jgi:hypothetical protein
MGVLVPLVRNPLKSGVSRKLYLANFPPTMYDPRNAFFTDSIGVINVVSTSQTAAGF